VAARPPIEARLYEVAGAHALSTAGRLVADRRRGWAVQPSVLPARSMGLQLGARRAEARWAAVVLAGCACLACSEDDRTRVEFYIVDGYSFSWLERAAVRAIALSTVEEVRSVLPGLPDELIVRVQAGNASEVKDTGEDVIAVQPAMAMWSVDPKHADGVSSIARAHLRPSLFHALSHLLREQFVEPQSMLDRAVMEGLAIAIERDYANVSRPWGWYPADAAMWVDELRNLPDDVERQPWLSRHPDGRRWIVCKAGTYLVDRAVRASGRSPVELIARSTREIVELAEGG
jgi:hypothetical protein